MSPVVIVSFATLDAALIAQGLYGLSKYRREVDRETPGRPEKHEWPPALDD